MFEPEDNVWAALSNVWFTSSSCSEEDVAFHVERAGGTLQREDEGQGQVWRQESQLQQL